MGDVQDEEALFSSVTRPGAKKQYNFSQQPSQ